MSPGAPPGALAEGCAWVRLPPEEEGEALPAPPDTEAGGAVVLGPDGGPAELSQADLIAAAERLQGEIPPGEPGRREILVAAGRLEEPAERALVAWATVSGAALLLEPHRESLVATAVWARPTVFAGAAGEIARLRLAAEREGSPWWWRKRPRRPFGRLRAVILTDPEEPSPDAVRFWEDRGVRLLPQSGKAVVYRS